jgi:hypothetical protein
MMASGDCNEVARVQNLCQPLGFLPQDVELLKDLRIDRRLPLAL